MGNVILNQLIELLVMTEPSGKNGVTIATPDPVNIDISLPPTRFFPFHTLEH